MKAKIENTGTVAYKDIMENLFTRIAAEAVIAETYFPYELTIEGDDVEMYVTIMADDVYGFYREEAIYRRDGHDIYVTQYRCTEWGINHPKYEYILLKAVQNQLDFMLKEGMLEIPVET